MRVLHLIDTTGPGGAETVFVELADRMRMRGHETVALLRGEGWVADEMRRRAVPFDLLPRSGGFDLALLRRLLALIRRERIDVIQSHLLGSNLYGSIAGLVTGKPLVATFHGTVDVADDERLRWLKFRLMRAGARHFVVVSQDLKRRLMADHPECASRTHVIYNGIDVARYRDVTPLDVRRMIDCTDDRFLVGLVGNVRPAKAYDLLLDIAARVCRAHPNVCFVVAGQGRDDLMAPLLARRTALGLDEHVHFLGFVADIPGFLAGLDLFMLCSRTEGFSIATLEAMAAGVAVLASRSGGPEEIIEHGRTGMLLPNGDAAAFAECIGARITGQGPDTTGPARCTVKRGFSLDAMLDGYENLYRQAVAG